MQQRTPVLIVGGGPTGLLASILLSKHAVSHVLVEQRDDTVNAPAAHVVNTRTMEIYRQAGLDVDELYALNTHPTAHLVAWKSRLQHESIGVFDMAANRDALMAQSRFSAQHTTNISQHRLEAYLKHQAEASEFADIRFGVEWQGFGTSDKRSSCLRDKAGNEIEMHYDYLLAADGASSSVARSLGIKKVGPDAIATFLNLTCEVDVSRAAGERETLLYWLLDPEVQGTIIVHDPQGLSVYMRPIAVPYESIEDFNDERCDTLLKKVFGEQPFRVRHKGIWKMTAQVAEKFRDGPVFLAGDAIHRFPPTGGLGLNTGVGDVHNLVWKLAVALKGHIEPERSERLLDSYEAERRPVAQRNCDVSKSNNDKMVEVIRAAGLDPRKAGTLARIMNSGFAKRLPAAVKRSFFTVLVQPVKSVLRAAEDQGARGAAIREEVASAISNQREHFSSIGLDLGYVYHEGCAVAEDARDTPVSEVSRYTEVLGAGARLPHRSLADSSVRSTHDLLDYTAFTLLSAGTPNSAPPDTFGVPVNRIDLTTFASKDALPIAESLGLAPGQWALVRPDGHTVARG